MHHTSPKPHQPQDIQHSPVKTNVNPPTQPSIPDEETQHVPKSTNGNQVKHSKPQPRQKDEHLCFYCNQLGHLKRNCPELPYCSKCRTRGHTPDKCTSKPQQNRHTRKATEESRDQWRRNQDLPQFSNRNNRCLHCAEDHQTRDCATTQQQQAPTTNKPASGTGTSTHSHQPAINTVNPLYMFKHRPSTLMLPIFNLTYTNPLPHHLHKITNPLTIIRTNNKFIHRQHNHLIHIFHNHSTHRFHHRISQNTHLLTVHL